MLLKKAAIFGLDARIALAIFGSLSVISGAALYSAIQEAKVTSVLTEMSEIEKGLKQYILDTKKDLPQGSTSLISKTENLIENNGDRGWNGPYLNYEFLLDNRLAHKEFDWLTIDKVADITFKYSPSVGGCASHIGTTCYYWLVFDEVPNNLAEKLDERIDSIADDSNGKFRHSYRTDDTRITYYRLFPTIEQL